MQKRADSFKHPVVFDGEVIAICPSAEEAARFHQALSPMGEEIEIVPPPPPSSFIGESGIPQELFESGGNIPTPHFFVRRVELKSPDQLALLLREWRVVGKEEIGGKVFLNLEKLS